MFGQVFFLCLLLLAITLGAPIMVLAQSLKVASTTLSVSICGNAIVDGGEQCDIPGEVGVYSQTIVGRQCSAQCFFGPYCGDGILQTLYGEECDDANNENADFCSAICKIEPAGSGGGGSSGGGSGGGGGRDREMGDTVINIAGRAYPQQTINFLLDTKTVGSARTNGQGEFEFSIGASPGTATLGLWSTDAFGTRSITLNNTFDVTQGAVTNLNGIILPPTLRLSKQKVNPGEAVELSGQSAPDSTIELHVNDSEVVETARSGTDGKWTLNLDTGKLRTAEHTLKARSITGNPPLTTQSSFSSSLQLFVGVDGKPTGPSDLNRDSLINLIDFSILIFWWGGDGGDSDPPADISGNGRVGLEDFSILLFNWTG